MEVRAYSLNGESIAIEGIRNASDDVPYVAFRVRGPRDGRIADLYLNLGHVEQLEAGLALAKAEARREVA